MTYAAARRRRGPGRRRCSRHRGVGKGDARRATSARTAPSSSQVLFGVRAARRRLRARQHPAGAAGDRSRARRLAARACWSTTREFADARRSARRRPVGIAHVVVTGDGPRERPGSTDCRGRAATPIAPVDVALDDPAAIIYTSGTTGRAEGRGAHPRQPHLGRAQLLVDYDVVSTDVALMISPLFHVASLGMGALPVILKGATIVLEKGFEPGRALRSSSGTASRCSAACRRPTS